MKLYKGKLYNDDRLFILDLSPAVKGNRSVWAVITRRNCEGFPPFRADEFETKKEAINFIVQIEPTTPLISLAGKSPDISLPYLAYCETLRRQGIPSAMEIYQINKTTERKIILEELDNEMMNN